MKVVYFGGDSFFSCFELLHKKNLEIVKVYLNAPLNSAEKLAFYCDGLQIEASVNKPSIAELSNLVNEGVELFIVAGYRYKLPLSHVPYAVNIHPTLLPKGRGPMPWPFVVEHKSQAGVTIHRLSDSFDAGDIILQESICVADNDSVSGVLVKTSLVARSLLDEFLDNLEKLYLKAIPQKQKNSSYFPAIEASDRVLSWDMNIDEIGLLIRRFGHWGIFLKVNNKLTLLNNLQAVHFTHCYQEGTIIYEDCDLLGVAVMGGFVCIPKCKSVTLRSQ